jgi:hypothetical protein
LRAGAGQRQHREAIARQFLDFKAGIISRVDRPPLDEQRLLHNARKESRMLPDFPREYGEYWNPAKEWDADTLDEIADVLADLKPPDFMAVDLAEIDVPPVIDANELLWAARVRASLVRVYRNVIPAVRENVKLVSGGASTPARTAT